MISCLKFSACSAASIKEIHHERTSDHQPHEQPVSMRCKKWTTEKINVENNELIQDGWCISAKMMDEQYIAE